jgi:hypothetical protein
VIVRPLRPVIIVAKGNIQAGMGYMFRIERCADDVAVFDALKNLSVAEYTH